jgi:hypothetical protein
MVRERGLRGPDGVHEGEEAQEGHPSSLGSKEDGDRVGEEVSKGSRVHSKGGGVPIKVRGPEGEGGGPRP